MEHHSTRYPWIRRHPKVRIEDLFTQVATGDSPTAIRRLTKKWLRAVLRRAVDPIRVESCSPWAAVPRAWAYENHHWALAP
jgi:hypothetical protein